MILSGSSRDDPGFLKELSARSGSFSREVKQTRLLDDLFTEIHNELTSLYYINYYSPIRHREKRGVEIQSLRKGVRLRWMAVN